MDSPTSLASEHELSKLPSSGSVLLNEESAALIEPSTVVRIGALAKRGKERCQQKWSATADYLTNTLPEIQCTLVPLDFEEIGPALQDRRIDFLLTNPALFIELETTQTLRPVATLRNAYGRASSLDFGGTVFCRVERSDIN